jgi:hypothetical protein
MVQAWVSGAIVNHGMQISLASGNETTGSQYWGFCSLNYDTTRTDSCNTSSHQPALAVTYVQPPDPIAVSTMCAIPGANDSCTSPETAATTFPTLSAATTDPAGLDLNYTF